MWDKFKESNFAKKCKELSGRGGVVATVVVIVLALTVVLTMSIATNRAKKKYGLEDGNGVGTKVTEGAGSPIEKETDPKVNGGNKNEETEDATVNAPIHNEQSEAPVDGDVEEFKLELPVSGVSAKGHDATIQVWNETLGAYKVHLGLDIAAEDGAPVLAAADGTVEKVWDDAMMGKCVAINHGGEIYTFYKNLDPVLSAGIEENAKVKCGQQIGKVGESAISELADEPHLHMEMTVGGLAVDPSDYFSQQAKDTIASVSGSYKED